MLQVMSVMLIHTDMAIYIRRTNTRHFTNGFFQHPWYTASIYDERVHILLSELLIGWCFKYYLEIMTGIWRFVLNELAAY